MALAEWQHTQHQPTDQTKKKKDWNIFCQFQAPHWRKPVCECASECWLSCCTSHARLCQYYVRFVRSRARSRSLWDGACRRCRCRHLRMLPASFRAKWKILIFQELISMFMLQLDIYINVYMVESVCGTAVVENLCSLAFVGECGCVCVCV